MFFFLNKSQAITTVRRRVAFEPRLSVDIPQYYMIEDSSDRPEIRHRRRGKLRILHPICVGGALTSAPLPYQTREIESDEKAAAEIYLC